jgi:hypothetical protein
MIRSYIRTITIDIIGNRFATAEVSVPRFKYAVFPFTASRLLRLYRTAFMAGVFQCGSHRNHAAIVKWCHFQEVSAPTL